MAANTKTYLVFDPRNISAKPKPILVRVDPEFESLIAPLQPDERAQLEADIRENGARVRDKIVVWGGEDEDAEGSVLLDGHTRLAILAELQAEYLAEGVRHPQIVAEVREFGIGILPDRAAAMLWIEQNQIGRRNLTDDQRAMIWASILERRSAIAKSERAATARAAQDPDPETEPLLSAKTTDKPPEPPAKHDTRKEVAAESKLPEKKLRAAAKLKKEHPEEAQAVRAGKKTMREATKQTKPKPQPTPAAAPLTWKEVMSWFEEGRFNINEDARDDSEVDLQRYGSTQNVALDFSNIDPTTAKKLVEYYLRLKAAAVPPEPEPPIPDHAPEPQPVDPAPEPKRPAVANDAQPPNAQPTPPVDEKALWKQFNAARREARTIMDTYEYCNHLDGGPPLSEAMEKRLDNAMKILRTTQTKLEALGMKFHSPAEAAKERRERNIANPPPKPPDYIVRWGWNKRPKKFGSKNCHAQSGITRAGRAAIHEEKCDWVELHETMADGGDKIIFRQVVVRTGGKIELVPATEPTVGGKAAKVVAAVKQEPTEDTLVQSCACVQ